MSSDELRRIRDALHDARFEIQQLRRTNEILRAKVEVLDLFAPLIHTNSLLQPAMKMSMDVVHALDLASKIVEEAVQLATQKANPE